jgi:hypothetical protein
VANGALEILSALKMRQVSPSEFLSEKFGTPVFTQLMVEDYYKTADGSPVEKAAFYADPSGCESNFMPYAAVADMYVSCHYWGSRSPFIFTRNDAKQPEFNLKVVADISCDIDGPVASTLRPSTIADPLYGYHPEKEEEVDFNDPEAVGVMAVDNLPCELPKDASEDFGRELVRNIFPALLGEDPDEIIKRATETTLDGKLSEDFAYLQGFVDGKE